MNPFSSLAEYERLVYTLRQRIPSILRSTLVIIRRGARFAELRGEIEMESGFRLVVYERLSWDSGPVRIEGYSYEAWRASDKVHWYDSQPHPGDAVLASSHPHHKHMPPDIKHHRVPAPELAFDAPNLSFLIGELERAGKGTT